MFSVRSVPRLYNEEQLRYELIGGKLHTRTVGLKINIIDAFKMCNFFLLQVILFYYKAKVFYSL
jgi:hypothetical protein